MLFSTQIFTFLFLVLPQLILSTNNLDQTRSLRKKENNDAILTDIEVDRCTTIVVGPQAGTTGPMNTHTADCSDCDFRINKVPARDWPVGSLRPLYQYKGNYPATITANRGSTWQPSNLEGTPDQIAAWGKESIITGSIPQVSFLFPFDCIFLYSDDDIKLNT